MLNVKKIVQIEMSEHFPFVYILYLQTITTLDHRAVGFAQRRTSKNTEQDAQCWQEIMSGLCFRATYTNKKYVLVIS